MFGSHFSRLPFEICLRCIHSESCTCLSIFIELKLSINGNGKEKLKFLDNLGKKSKTEICFSQLLYIFTPGVQTGESFSSLRAIFLSSLMGQYASACFFSCRLGHSSLLLQVAGASQHSSCWQLSRLKIPFKTARNCPVSKFLAELRIAQIGKSFVLNCSRKTKVRVSCLDEFSLRPQFQKINGLKRLL